MFRRLLPLSFSVILALLPYVAIAQNLPGSYVWVTNPTSVPVPVTCTSGCSGGGGGGGTSAVDESTFTPGTTPLTPAGGVFLSAPGTLANGQTGAFSMTADRMLFVNLGKVGNVAVSLGQKTMSASFPVTIASDQSVLGTNETQLAGTAIAVGQGATSSGVQRVLLSQDNSSAAINISTATTTQLLALSSGKAVYVMAADVIAGGTGNITFEYGTGTNCGTGTTALTGAYPLTAQTGFAKGDGTGTVWKIPASNALCALTSAAVQMSGSFAFQQF